MENLIAASGNFYDNSKEEEVNADLFNSFMRRITVWDYYKMRVLQESIIFHYQIMKKRSR